MRSGPMVMILRCLSVCLLLLDTCKPFTVTPSSSCGSVVLKAGAKEDPFRCDARPSLHPITINTLAEIVRRRVTTNDFQKPALEQAMAASAIATEQLHQRQQSSDKDGMAYSVAEQQTIVGRVVGVTLRYDSLVTVLQERCAATPWIAKYNEWHAFGCCDTDASTTEQLAEDPLLRVHRAETLLALFLHQIEIPELAAKNVTVPDESVIDFLDEDRREVLLL